MSPRSSSPHCVLFLNGIYPLKELPFYASLCEGKKFLVAVDGGFQFFRLTKTKPHVLIGDMDSIREIPNDPEIAIVTHPRAKDSTDAELALVYCLQVEKAKRVDIVQPSYGEPDQFIGNLMLPALALRKRGGAQPEIRIINSQYEAIFVRDSSLTFRDCMGDLLSVIPLSRKAKFSCRGTAFDVRDRDVFVGLSLSLRNVITAKRAVVEVIGDALCIRQHGPRAESRRRRK